MNLETALGNRRRVEAFQRRHRTGLVSLLFTDIVGSTKLKQEMGDHRAVKLLERHHALVRKVLSQFREGEEISTAGDSFFLVFTRPSDAVKFSLLLQHQLRCLSERSGHEIADRIGLHVGEVIIAEPSSQTQKDLFGIQVDTCSRVSALAQGRQILMTRFAFDSARQALNGEELSGIGPLVWMNHGRYRLKGVEEPIELCAVGEQDSAAATRPPSTEKGRRIESVADEPVLGWRPAIEQQVPQTRWVLERMLGEGGFGEVWLARHQVLGDRCVFKFCFRADRARSLRREVTLFRVMRERFGAHPRIVAVRDVFFDEPPYYLAMDYSDSTDLRAWCEARGGVAEVPIPVRLEIAAQVADALQAAHEAGVIHRDVKPGNILVSGDGSDPSNVQIKLTDFGIGQIVSDEVLGGLTKGGFTQTMSSGGEGGSLTGTYLYMAPELIAGQPASATSDVYALGVVLYQMLLGDFTAPVTMDWMEEIKETALRKELARCFAGNRGRRFERVADLAQNLRNFQSSPSPPSVTVADDKPSPARGPVVRSSSFSLSGIADPQPLSPRSPATPPGLIDLSPFYNAPLSADWTNRAGYNVAALSRQGRIRVQDAEFDPRGIIQVGCFKEEKLKAAYPERVDGIPIRRKCRQIHFLHAALGREPDGSRIGSYIIHYAGAQQEIPLLYGEDLRSWLCESDREEDLKRATIAWTGRTVGLFLRSIRLFKLTWKNPLPDEEVASLDFQSVAAHGAPFLLALTVD